MRGGCIYGGARGQRFVRPSNYRELSQKLGIDTSHVKQVEGLSSGVAPIFVEPDGQNRILVVKGANDALKPTDVDAAADMLKATDCIVLPVLKFARNGLLHHRIRAKTRNSMHSEFQPRGKRSRCRELAGLDYFVPNESEAETITGIACKISTTRKDARQNWWAIGIRRVIITLGSKGSLLAGRDLSEHVPAFPVKAIDSTGAGDAFIGSFAVFLAEGLPELEVVRRANLYAGLSTTGVGTQKSFYDRQRFDAEWAGRSEQ